MSPSSALKLEVIRNTEQLESIVEVWSQLWNEDWAATPFQSPEWLLPWWRYFSEGDLFVIALRQDGRLYALLPFYIHPAPERDERQLLFLGAGTSDYLDGLFHKRRMTPMEQDAMASLVVECLMDHRELWDAAYLKQLRNDSPILDWANLFPSGSRRYPSEPCSSIWIDQGKRLPQKMSRNIGYYRRSAEQRGKLQFAAATEETALAVFDCLISLHQQRWETTGQCGVLAEERVRQHHREAIPLLHSKQILRLYSLMIDDKIIGVFYGLADPSHRKSRKVYYYLSGFDPEFSMVSPGTLLLAAGIDEAKAEGAVAIDLLRGGEQYKRLWGAEFYPTYAIELRLSSRSARQPARGFSLQVSA